MTVLTDDPAAATTRDGGELVAACDAVLQHVVDVHCHPTESPATLSPDSMHRLPITICPMASRKSDQPRVRALAQAHPDKVIPGYGQLQPHHFHYSTIHVGCTGMNAAVSPMTIRSS